MDTPRRVLAAIPPTALGPVVAGRAAALAKDFGAELCLAACVYDPYVAGERFADSPELAQAREALVQSRRIELEALADQLQTANLSVSVAATWSYPVYSGLVELAENLPADLLVAGTFHHSRFERWGRVSSDWALLQHASCPILLVRGNAYSGYQNVLAAIDPMHAQDEQGLLDAQILAAAGVFAGLHNARVQMLHCYLGDDQIPLVAPGAVAYYARQSSRAAHTRAVEALLARLGLSSDTLRMESGDAGEVIARVAKDDAVDLVVMGAVSRSRLRRWLVGSTAERVLDRLDCDVLIVRPPADT